MTLLIIIVSTIAFFVFKNCPIDFKNQSFKENVGDVIANCLAVVYCSMPFVALYALSLT